MAAEPVEGLFGPKQPWSRMGGAGAKGDRRRHTLSPARTAPGEARPERDGQLAPRRCLCLHGPLCVPCRAGRGWVGSSLPMLAQTPRHRRSLPRSGRTRASLCLGHGPPRVIASRQLPLPSHPRGPRGPNHPHSGLAPPRPRAPSKPRIDPSGHVSAPRRADRGAADSRCVAEQPLGPSPSLYLAAGCPVPGMAAGSRGGRTLD